MSEYGALHHQTMALVYLRNHLQHSDVLHIYTPEHNMLYPANHMRPETLCGRPMHSILPLLCTTYVCMHALPYGTQGIIVYYRWACEPHQDRPTFLKRSSQKQSTMVG